MVPLLAVERFVPDAEVAVVPLNDGDVVPAHDRSRLAPGSVSFAGRGGIRGDGARGRGPALDAGGARDHRLALIVDGHLDLAYNTLVDGRDYARSALAIRAEEAGGPIETSNGRCMVGLPELLAGDVRLIIATLFAMPRSEAGKGECGYVNQHGAHEQALAQLAIYRRWADEIAEFDLVGGAADLDRPPGRVGIALLIENADCIRTLGRRRDFPRRRACGWSGRPG